MARKLKRPTPKITTSGNFALERSPWFVPIAFGVIFIALMILFGPFVFSDKMLHGSDTIQAGVFFRSMLVDNVLEHGAVPQWNPYIFCGMPYVEAFHGDIFYPLSSLKYFGSLYRALGLNLVLHIFLAGLFMFFAARRFMLSKIASLLSAVCYMFAAYLVSLVAPGHDGKIFVTALFPLVIYFLEGGFRSSGMKSVAQFSILGLTIGVIILSPHPQMSYYTLWALSFYAAFRLFVIFRDKKSVMPLFRPAALTVYAVVIGLSLSAIQFYPGYKYTTEFSPRADSKSGWEWATSWSMHEEEAFSQLVPEFVGTSNQKLGTYYWGKNYFKDNSESIGIVTILMALLGCFFYRRREAYFFTGLALFAFIYALGATTPIFRLFYLLIPKVDSLRAPSMIMFLYSFSMALLAGMGLQYLRDSIGRKESDKSQKWFNYILFGFPGLMLLVALLFGAAGKSMMSLWTGLFYSEAATTQLQPGITKLDLALRHLPHIQSGAWIAFLFCAAAAAVIWLFRQRKLGAGFLIVLIALSMIDGVRFNRRFVDTVDPTQHWSPSPITKFLQQQQDHYRTMNLGVVPEDFLPFFKIEVVTGYHGNQLRWFDQLLGGPGARNKANPDFLNLCSARYLLLPSNQQVPEGYFGSQLVAEVASYRGVSILENKNALPRVFMADSYQVVTERNDIYPMILKGEIDPRKVVLLEEEPDLTITARVDSATAGDYDKADIISFTTDSVIVQTTVSENRILVMTDTYYDAWHVFVDDQPAKLMRAYGAFRAVAIPAGATKVKFVFDSPRYSTGKTVTLFTLAWLVLVLGFYGIQLYRKRPEEAIDNK